MVGIGWVTLRCFGDGGGGWARDLTDQRNDNDLDLLTLGKLHDLRLGSDG